MDTPHDPEAVVMPLALFSTTRWSLVLAAKDKDSPESGNALEALCRQYWYPLYAFVRNLGHSPHDAQDLTQEFFARLLEREFLQRVEPDKGRFRTFLRTALRRFLANEWDKVRAQKRGGHIIMLAFDTTMAEDRLQLEPVDERSPDRAYDRRWALALLEEASSRLEREYVLAGKLEEFEALRPHLIADRGAIPYDELGLTLGCTPATARVTMHRLRQRFREVFRATVADTVASREEFESEYRHILEALQEV